MAKLTQADKVMYEQFMAEFDCCWSCLWPKIKGLSEWGNRLENAHIIGGPCRKHDRRVIVRLCSICHQVSHGANIRNKITNEYLPKFGKAEMLWLKKKWDSEYFDLDYCNKIAISRMPELKEMPEIYHARIARHFASKKSPG